MYSPAQSGANAYARVGVETGVMGASPHKLIALLFQGARQAIARARLHMQTGNVGPRGESISKAIRIIEGGLQASLNMEVGGEIAQRLNALYGYMARRLFEANVKRSEDMLIEVDRLLATLESSWLKIAPEAARIAAEQTAAASSQPLNR